MLGWSPADGGATSSSVIWPSPSQSRLSRERCVVRALGRPGISISVDEMGVWAPATLAVVASGVGRGSAGAFVRPSKTPDQPLELYSFEASPFCRLVRERLCELELPYRLHNVARGSAAREAFVERSGKMQVPYLADPNTGVEMFESADIVRYLDETYAKAPAPGR